MFDPFGDFESKGYLRNAEGTKDLEEIKLIEHSCFEASLSDALEFLRSEDVLSYSTLKKVHEMLFIEYYPWAGKDRQEVAPDLVISKGSKDSEYHTVFAPPSEIEKAVDYGLSIARDPKSFREKSGTVMGQIAFAHPFLDGNGRSLLLFHLELTHRAGFSVDWAKTDKNHYLKYLSKEIDEPRQHLDKYLRDLVIDKVPRDKWPDVIGNIKGLDGIDKDNRIYGSSGDPLVNNYYAKDRYLKNTNEITKSNFDSDIVKISSGDLVESDTVDEDFIRADSKFKDSPDDYEPQ